MKLLAALLIPLSLAPGLARAAELYEIARPISAYGTGGVYLPWVGSTDAVRWNPALLADVDELAWKFADVGLGTNGSDMLQTVRDLSDSGCSGSSCFDLLYGKPLNASFNGESTFVLPHWGATIFTGGKLQGTLNNPAFPAFDLTFERDYGIYTAAGFGLGPGLSAGVALKRINRWGGFQSVSLSTITGGDFDQILDDFNQRGTAYGVDASLMYRSPEILPLRTTAVLHWQDIGCTAFLPDEAGGTAPDRIRDNMSAGVGMELDLPGLDLRFGTEYRHSNKNDEPFGKKLHIGAELGLPLIDLRAGLNQGYPAVGAGLDLYFMRFDVASYTEETGAYPGQTPSQRFQLGLSFELSVDADFSFTDKDGKRRKLKQRR